MTNREWLIEQMQNMRIEEFCNFLQDCNLKEYGVEYDTRYGKCMCEWLEARHEEKPKLSDAERVILENIDKEFKWITREIDDRLHIHKNKPEKRGYWCSDLSSKTSLKMFKQLFQFITWDDSEPYNIEELLKGE